MLPRDTEKPDRSFPSLAFEISPAPAGRRRAHFPCYSLLFPVPA